MEPAMSSGVDTRRLSLNVHSIEQSEERIRLVLNVVAGVETTDSNR